MANLLEKASIVLTPTAYNNGEALCIKPDDGSGDFQFSRNSAATRVNAQGLVENVQILSGNLVQNGSFSEEGVQEVSNGSFSQEGAEQADDSVISNDGNAVMTKVSALNYNATSDGTGGSTIRPRLLFNNTPLGKNYRLIIKPTNQSGTINFKLYNGSSYLIDNNDLSSDIDFYFSVEGGAQALIAFDGTEAFNVDFEISLKEVGQDWDLGTGWSVADGMASRIQSAAASYLTQTLTIPLVQNKVYKITYTATIPDGNLRPELTGGGGTSEGTSQTTSGTYTDYIKAENNHIKFRFRANADFNGSVTNISVKEVLQDWSVEDYSGVTASAIITPNIEGVKLEKTISADWRSSFLSQQISYTTGNKYKATFKLKNGNLPSGGNVFVRSAYEFSGATIVSNLTLSNNWVEYTYYFVADSVSDDISFGNVNWQNSGVGEYFYINDVSVIEITDDTNLPRINYEGFSYQDALGSELVTNGDFDSDLTGWSKFGTATAIGGVATIGASSSSGIFQNILTNGSTYSVTINVVSYDGVGTAEITNNNGVNIYTITTTGEQTFTFTHSISSGKLVIRGISNALFSLSNVSVKEVIGQEVVPDSGCGSWLFEPQSTNLIPYSEDFSEWLLVQATLTSNYGISPDGTQNSTRVVFSSSGQEVRDNVTTSAISSGSLYVKGVSGETIKFGLLGSEDIFTLNGDWQRLEKQGTSTSNRIGINTYSGATARDLEIWGAQLENQSYATSYIPTSGTSVTRNQDVCNNTNATNLLGQAEGSFLIEINKSVASAEILNFNRSTSNSFQIFTDSDNYKVLAYYEGSNYNKTTSLPFTDSVKIGVSYKNNEYKLYANGTEIFSTTVFNWTPNTPLSRLSFNQGGYVAGNKKSEIKALAVWKEALSDEELTELTS